MTNIKSKRVLISPLDWGLGHATRCIPIIHELIQQNYLVVLAIPKSIRFVWESEFPNQTIIDAPAYNISYAKHEQLWFKMLLSSRRILNTIKQEQKWLEEIVSQYKIDIVISDNRFGLSTSKCKCVYITHQLKIKAPFFTSFINKMHLSYIERFDECWIPDNLQSELSGELTKGTILNIKNRFVGVLSGLKEPSAVKNIKYDFALLLSGPEPQRSILEKKLLQVVTKSKKRIILIRGRKSDGQALLDIPERCDVLDYANRLDLQQILEETDVVVCRSGYSTIMDLSALGKKVFFIPTPGQLEQEYLAEYLFKTYQIDYCKQSEINDSIFFKSKYSQLPTSTGNLLLKEAISSL